MIKELLQKGQFTTQEKAVVDYIYNNPEIILHATAKKLAQLTFVSPPTIVRMIKKIGFSSYLEFQLAYAKEHSLLQNNTVLQLTKNSSLDDIIEALPKVYHLIYQETKNILKKDVLNRIINYALQAKHIDFYGNDNNHNIIDSTCSKLNSLGFHAYSFNTISDHYIASLEPKTTLAFIISHTGNNPTMINNALYLKNKGIRVVAITSFPNSPLEKICHDSLLIDANLYSLPKELHLYGISIHYVLEILVTALAYKKSSLHNT